MTNSTYPVKVIDKNGNSKGVIQIKVYNSIDDLAILCSTSSDKISFLDLLLLKDQKFKVIMPPLKKENELYFVAYAVK